MSRDSSGNYSLPLANVVTGTTISSSWANTSFSDFSTEFTNSLDRTGRGGMLAPLRCADGSAAAPSFSFTAETGTGFYRAGTNDLRVVMVASALQKWTPTAVTIYPATVLSSTLAVTGAATLSSTLAVTGATTLTGAASTAAGLTATNSTTNGAAITATGNGTGSGLVATAGAPAAAAGGAGGTFTGGTPSGGNNNGGAGVVATGGAASGSGTGGNGVTATGTGAGHGVAGTGGSTGRGGNFTGGPGQEGVRAIAGTAATASTAYNALGVVNGYIGFGTVNPNGNVAFSNTVTPANIVKAWVVFSCTSAGAITVLKRFNVDSVIGNANDFIVAFPNNGYMTDGDFCVSIQNHIFNTTHGPLDYVVVSSNQSGFRFGAYVPNTGAVATLPSRDGKYSVMVLGQQ